MIRSTDHELHDSLSVSESTDDSKGTEKFTEYLPVRMINEFVYCPRLFYLMHVEGQFADSYETIDGGIVHRRVDSGNGHLPSVNEPAPSNDLSFAAEELDDPPADALMEQLPQPKRKRRKHIQPPTLFVDPEDDSEDDTSSPVDDASPNSSRPPSKEHGAETANDREQEDESPATIHARSVTLSSDALGVIGKLDLVEATGDVATPVDYKRGRPKKMSDGSLDAWPPEKVQISLQAALLRDNGYRVNEGVLYFNTTRQRVVVRLDSELENQTAKAIQNARQLFESRQIPAPLEDSPKCAKCSLLKICLPDETRSLMPVIHEHDADAPPATSDVAVRPMITARDERRPLYLNQQGLMIGKKDDLLIVKEDRKVIQQVRLREINQLSLFGNIQLSTQAVQHLLHMNIPVAYFTRRGWFYGTTQPLGVKNILVRREQFRKADDPVTCLRLARELVRGKIRNSRTLLMRNHVEPPRTVLAELKRLSERVLKADSLASLLGLEGTAARIYFSQFTGMLKVKCDIETDPGSALSERRPAFDFRGRNRRPPRDPVNALLSLAFSLLTKDCTIASTIVGLDPYLGFYHQVKPGKPALALDLMEPFRPLIAESVVLTAINNRMVIPEHFIVAGKSVVLSDAGRKGFLMAYEQRMDALVTHPLFGYRVSYRRLLEIQTRLLGRWLTGEISEYPVFITR
jgi:CRISPR-associated protein Cas1